jgi:hypothetical protein
MNQTEGRESLYQLDIVMSNFLANPEIFSCPLPCERNRYTYNMHSLHENAVTSEPPDLEDFYCMYFYYSSFQVEQHVETPIYDVGGLLAAAGGNLGLCLGFSCLSILLASTQWTMIDTKGLKIIFLLFIEIYKYEKIIKYILV